MDNQQITKIINYYRINHNFHSPYTFLIDGNFLKLLIEKDINFEQKLKSLLTGKIKIKTTNCIVEQLKLLGDNFIIILQKAKQMQIFKCDHKIPLRVHQCIIDSIKKQQNVIICSQDKLLRRKLRWQNIPIIYFGPDQRITMEDIEKHQLKQIQQQQKIKFLPNKNQQSEITQHKQKQQIISKIKNKKQQLKQASHRGIQLKYIKKKIVKGANPLSIKKKNKRKIGNIQEQKIGNNQNNQDNESREDQLITNENLVEEHQQIDEQQHQLTYGNVHKEKRIRKRKKKSKQNFHCENNTS